MNGDLPPPLVPADVDLTDFQFMPLDVARLRDSELASNETPEACWAAVLLWAASWHQVPAASVPNDDRWLAKAAGYVARGKIDPQWAKVRDGALRGFVACSDGRLYHPVVAEKAREGWSAKLKQRWCTECARIKKHNERHEGANVPKPTFEAWVAAGCPQGQPLFVPGDKPSSPPKVAGETASKGQGEGQGQGQGQGQTTSAPDGAGGQPPPAAKPAALSAAQADKLTRTELWRVGKSLLAEQGMPRAQCGSFVGKLVKDHGEATVVALVREAVVQRPADAATWLVAACRDRKRGGRTAPMSGADQLAQSAAKAERIRASLAATGGAVRPAADLLTTGEPA